MKTIRILLVAVAISCTANLSMSQMINWKRLGAEQTSLVSLNVGWDFASTIGIGYGYRLNTTMPIVMEIQFSMPFGASIVDDFKVKLGGQAELLSLGNFSATVKAYGIFRRYENGVARLLNFGSEFSGIVGYYQPTWHAAAEIGFDKAITTQVINSARMRESFPDAKDGWYVPTAGNFYYGVQAAKSLNDALDFNLRLGATRAQYDDVNPSLPYYLQMGVGVKF
jgi:hypothetical protein